MTKIKNLILELIITFGKSGRLKPASGTWGSIAGAIFAYIIAYYTSPIILYPISFIIFLIGWWAVCVYQKQTNKHDASEIVIDEVCGILIPLAIVPVDIYWYFITFIIFRIFDILKPYPINIIDSLKTPFSVMFDDVVAGFMSLIVIWSVLWLHI